MESTNSRKKIAFVTCNTAKLPFYFPTKDEPDLLPTEPPFTPDDQLAVDCLRNNGFDVIPVEWGSNLDTLKPFDLVVMRSPWDYMDTDENRQEFVNWVESIKEENIPLENDSHLILWLLNKTYLKDFETVGTPIVPSFFIGKGSPVNVEDFLYEHQQVVLKPCVSGSAQGLFYVKSLDNLKSQKDEINRALKNNDYIVQPFIREIKTNGEWSLIYLDGQYSHAVHKIPGSNSILVHAEYGGTIKPKEPPEGVLHFGNLVIQQLPQAFKERTGQSGVMPLYLRIDVIQTDEGVLLSECEGVEPELFFRAKKGSEEIFARAIKKRLNNVGNT